MRTGCTGGTQFLSGMPGNGDTPDIKERSERLKERQVEDFFPAGYIKNWQLCF
ncbi:MAG: hypothetical protein ACLR8P_09705 [Clostridium fessum]